MAKDTPSTPTAPLSVNQAADAIVALINAQVRSPRHDEIASVVSRVATRTIPSDAGKTSELGLEIRATIARIDAINEQFSNIDDEKSQEWLRCERSFNAEHELLRQLATHLPLVPRSFSELLTIAEILYHWHDKELDGRLNGLDREDPCPHEYWTPRLILAVMTMGGRIHA